jgi:uncharacterized cupredoxin-like copper-binding protein
MTANMGLSSSMGATGGLVVDRTIALDANDMMRITPGTIEVQTGETVAFTVTNSGAIKHEFLIGDAAEQAEHEEEMASGKEEEMGMDGESNVLDLEPGETKTLVYTFSDEPGSTLYGCHEPGHYAAGMYGTITITEPASN